MDEMFLSVLTELILRNVSGFQMMYADSYMTREEFRAMFDHSLYDRYIRSLNVNDIYHMMIF